MHSKLRPPIGVRWRLTVGPSTTWAFFEWASRPRALPTWRTRAGSHVAPRAVPQGNDAEGAPVHDVPRTPAGPSDMRIAGTGGSSKLAVCHVSAPASSSTFCSTRELAEQVVDPDGGLWSAWSRRRASRWHCTDGPEAAWARRRGPVASAPMTVEHRRILLDGYATEVDAPRRRARGRRRTRGRRRLGGPPAAGRADEDRVRPPQLREPGAGVHHQAAAGADVLPQADHRPQRPRRRRRAAGGLPVAQLRGRDRHRHRPHVPQRVAGRGRPTTSPATRSPTTTASTTSATPTPGRCCG